MPKRRKIMRELDRGDAFVVTRNGVPIGELLPFPRRRFVPADVALAAFQDAANIDGKLFRADVDRRIDQDPQIRS